jgi:hypothetical protein
MDQILFYKEGQSLKATMEQVRLSYTRPYTMTFAIDYDQISSFFGGTSGCLLYYLVNDLQEADRIRLRYIQIHAPQIRVCLCAPAQYALDAWSLGVFHFEAQPVYSVGVEEAYRKYLAQRAKRSRGKRTTSFDRQALGEGRTCASRGLRAGSPACAEDDGI